MGRRRNLLEPSSTASLYTVVMASRLRSAVMWLLLFALPLQGFAAAAMLHCGPNHHRMAANATAEPAGPAQTYEHIAAGQHHHEAGMADAHGQAAPVDGSPGAPSLAHLDKLVKLKCNACAVCCMGAAMPTAIFTFEPFAPAMVPEFFVLTSHIGFVTDAPDRPPRLSHL